MYLINCLGIHLYTFSTFGHQTVLPAYIGVCGVAPWPVTLSTWVTTEVFCISQLRNYIYWESMLMGILNGSTNKLKSVVTHISSAAKFNIPIIPDISSIPRLKTTACIKPFHIVLKRDTIFSIQNFISKETSGFVYFDPPLFLLLKQCFLCTYRLKVTERMPTYSIRIVWG